MRTRPLASLLLLPALAGCSVWFFSGETHYDTSRPVALVETTGGVELGATTEFGVLTLGATADAGPCRVHYFLGPTPMVDDGVLRRGSPSLVRADIDLKTQSVRCFDRSPLFARGLVAMWTPDGVACESVAVQVAVDPRIDGDVLVHPGRELPHGAAVFAETQNDGLQFVGLVAAKATLGDETFYVFAGPDRIRELLAVPEQHPIDLVPKYRTDDISVMKPREVEEVAPPPPPTAPTVPGFPLPGFPPPK